jgi:hypothetical protein
VLLLSKKLLLRPKPPLANLQSHSHASIYIAKSFKKTFLKRYVVMPPIPPEEH